MDPRVKYQLSDAQKRDPALVQAMIAGDPNVKPEGMTQEQWQNKLQKSKVIDPYFQTARDTIAVEK